VLWKLTDDSMLPGEVFRVPLFMMLDALKSTDPELQRTAETWMRCNLRSYFRSVPTLGSTGNHTCLLTLSGLSIQSSPAYWRRRTGLGYMHRRVSQILTSHGWLIWWKASSLCFDSVVKA
jgi:hypothetical protein